MKVFDEHPDARDLTLEELRWIKRLRACLKCMPSTIEIVVHSTSIGVHSSGDLNECLRVAHEHDWSYPEQLAEFCELESIQTKGVHPFGEST